MCQKLKKLLFLLVISFSFIINIAQVFAQDKITVYINSTLIDYEEAEPQIINQRVMVPFRKTAETLGAEVDWNKTTETMTLTKGNITVVHTLRSNIITVNGEAITFDTPSTVINSRTLMPVRMLAEALKCTVEWNNEKRQVLITVSDATVNSVSTDSTNITDGERVTITVNASENTERIKIVDTSNNAIITETYTYTTLPNGSRVFSIPWTPQEGISTVKTLKVFAGTLLSYNEDDSSTKTFSLSISGSGKPSVIKAELASNYVARDEYVTLTVYANQMTDRIKVVNDLSENLTEIVNYTISENARVFTTKIKMSNRGDREIYIYPGNSDGYTTTYEKLAITVTGVGTSTSNQEKLNATLTIHDVKVNNDNVYIDEDVSLKVYTSSDIDRIEIQNSEETVLKRVNFPSNRNTSQNEYTWDASFTVSQSGRNKFYVVAYNGNQSTRYSLNITGENYSRNDLHILSVTQRETDAIIGDTVTFIAKTTSKASYIEVRESDYILQKVTDYTSEGSFKNFKFSVKLSSSNVNNLKVIAYDSNGLPVSQKIYPDYSEVSSPKIYEVELRNTEVYKDEYIRLNVYTNSAVSRVWVEDRNGVRMVLNTQYSSSSGGEYLWELKFPAEETGSRVLYTVYAKGENSTTDDYSFRVKVIN